MTSLFEFPAEQTAAGPVMLIITVYGAPAPQGSKSAFRNQHTGRIQQVESSKKVKPWREAVKHAALDAIGRPGDAWRQPPLDGALVVDMVFTFARPRSHYRTGRNNWLLRDNAPPRPISAPDLSKLVRSTEDALTDAAVWVDDARVTEYGRLVKVWANGADQDALDRPGAVIRVRRLSHGTR